MCYLVAKNKKCPRLLRAQDCSWCPPCGFEAAAEPVCSTTWHSACDHQPSQRLRRVCTLSHSGQRRGFCPDCPKTLLHVNPHFYFCQINPINKEEQPTARGAVGCSLVLCRYKHKTLKKENRMKFVCIFSRKSGVRRAKESP